MSEKAFGSQSNRKNVALNKIEWKVELKRPTPDGLRLLILMMTRPYKLRTCMAVSLVGALLSATVHPHGIDIFPPPA